MKRISILIIPGLLLTTCGQTTTTQRLTEKAASSSPSQVEDLLLISNSSGSSLSSVASAKEDGSSFSSPSSPPLPYSVALEVPFSPQAPFAIWDPLHEEACEEMSLLLVHHFLEGTGITREGAEAELQALIQWEGEHGYPQDVTVQELGRIAHEYFGHSARVIESPTAEDLKRLLADGHPVILPAAGRDLGNPFFSGEGPWYHMLVLTGYSEFFFITNDVGTKRGQGYEYRFPALMSAIHDWTGVKEDIREGARRVLVIEQ